ncbi:hypothetical protein DQ354_18690 [Arthrobacter sp. AQ5-06]|nr:hypothetical protein DQ354_18690 [Arthrobacter sp. AQ5-06]
MKDWDERHRAPIVVWESVSALRVQGRQRHIVQPPEHHHLTLDVLLQPRDSDTLIVALHGALDRGIYTPPRFEWMGTLAGRSESILYLSDPTITLSERLRLGWYVGNATDNLPERYAALIRATAEQCGASRILFFGFSGGGFAALALAGIMPGTTGIAFSPQTSIGGYYQQFADMFAEDVFPECRDYAEVAAKFEDRVSLLARYADPAPGTSFLYVQNTGDTHHMSRHYEPFRSLTEGMEGAHFRLRHDSDGHTVPPKEYLLEVLDECAASPLHARSALEESSAR